MTSIEWLKEYDEKQKAEKQRLANLYPNKQIKSLGIKQLKKFAYIMGLGYISGKRETIEGIMKYQNNRNPIIKVIDGNYEFNKELNIFEYIDK